MINRDNEFYQQIRNNLELQERVNMIGPDTKKERIGNWFNIIDLYDLQRVVLRISRDPETVKTDFTKSLLNGKFLRENRITKAIDSCLLAGYQPTRAFYKNYEDLIKEYKKTKTPNEELSQVITCIGHFFELLNYGIITNFEQTRFGADINGFITEFEKSFANLNDEQKEVAKKYVNEVLCSILMFNMLDRKTGNVLIDENGKINFIDFDDLLENKDETKKVLRDQLLSCIASSSGRHYNTEKVERLDYKKIGDDGKTKLMPSRKEKYINYNEELFKKYDFKIDSNMLDVIDKMLKINENMIKAMFVNIKAVEQQDFSFEEAKKHIVEKLDALLAYRRNLVNTLTEECRKEDGWCLNNHDCIISPNEIVDDNFKNELRTKIYNNISELNKCKTFLTSYTETEFNRDCHWAETLYKIEKEPIENSNAQQFQTKEICK